MRADEAATVFQERRPGALSGNRENRQSPVSPAVLEESHRARHVVREVDADELRTSAAWVALAARKRSTSK